MTGQSNSSQGHGHDRLRNWNPKNGGMLISHLISRCLTNHSELCMSRLLNNQPRRISIYRLQRRPSFGFQSSVVSSTPMTSGDPVVVTWAAELITCAHTYACVCSYICMRVCVCVAGVWGGAEDVVGETEDDGGVVGHCQSTRRAQFCGEQHSVGVRRRRWVAHSQVCCPRRRRSLHSHELLFVIPFEI